MIKRYKGREIVTGELYDVYRNLHRKEFSIKDVKTGKVVGHGTGFIMEDIQFKVLNGGKKRAIETGVRNVHAFVRGKISKVTNGDTKTGREVSYNPFSHGGFYYVDTGNEVDELKKVLIDKTKIYDIGGN